MLENGWLPTDQPTDRRTSSRIEMRGRGFFITVLQIRNRLIRGCFWSLWGPLSYLWGSLSCFWGLHSYLWGPQSCLCNLPNCVWTPLSLSVLWGPLTPFFDCLFVCLFWVFFSRTPYGPNHWGYQANFRVGSTWSGYDWRHRPWRISNFRIADHWYWKKCRFQPVIGNFFTGLRHNATVHCRRQYCLCCNEVASLAA